jgi:radical SAM superfamily enzyme YgiQ (UPF0313 family)
MKILFVWPNKDAPFFKPISIALFSAIFKKAGHQVKCFDTSFIDFGYANISDSTIEAKIHKPVDLSPYRLKKEKADVNKIFLKYLESYQPDVIAFSVISDEVAIAKQLSETAKKWRRDRIIIWGGKGPTVEPERILSFAAVDYVCVGEGIVALPEFIQALAASRSLKNIKNIWHRQEGKIIRNPLNPLFENLDSLPYFDWEVFDERLFFKPYEGKIYRGGDHMIAWGCPNDCTYCINHYYHGLYAGFKLQYYSPKRIIAELKHLTNKYKIEFFKFHDEDFLLKPMSYLEELSDLYAKEVGVPFTCMAHSNLVSPKGLELLKRMNCVSISLGIETGDPWIRKELFNRRDTEEDVIRAFALLKKAGIRSLAFNMLAVPFETRETYFRTIELNRRAEPQVAQIGFFFPFPGTRLREIAIANGFYNPNEEKVYDPTQPALTFKDLTESQLRMMKKRFTLYAKLPKDFWPYIERSETLDEIGQTLEKKLYQIFDETVFAHDGWYDDQGRRPEYLAELEQVLASKIANFRRIES